LGAYVLKRVARSILTLIAITMVVFVLTHLLGNPVAMLLPADASNELLNYTRHSLGLDDPLIVQFQRFVVDALQGDFGPSLFQGVSSRDLLVRSLPATGLLAGTAFIFASVIGLTLGILAALKPRSWLDNAVSLVSITGVSIPEFWLALLLIVFVAIPSNFLPTAGYGTPLHLILPAIVLSIRPLGRIAQIARGAMVDELRQPYVVTAHSKGLPVRTIIRRHVLKNAGIPIVTIAGIEVVDLLSGAIIVESVFGWPGVGWLAGNALRAMDFPLIQTVVVWAALVTVTVNLLVDLSYAWLNPRVGNQ